MKHGMLVRWHVWLGWLIGVPIILWTASGLLMVVRPIEEVRGTHLRSDVQARPLEYSQLALFSDSGGTIRDARLTDINGEWIWIVEYTNGGKLRFDAAIGNRLPNIDKREAKLLAKAAYEPEEKIVSVRLFERIDEMPLDYRRTDAAWQVQFADATNIYISYETGETLAVRTQFWRAFDFMWGLHIMDLQTREDSSHPILIGSAALALLGSILGFVLLFTRRRKSQAKRR